jgi:hypothetical protein
MYKVAWCLARGYGPPAEMPRAVLCRERSAASAEVLSRIAARRITEEVTQTYIDTYTGA